jgi:ubiquinone/menaquinone biosynthesis C-methylase UbiE
MKPQRAFLPALRFRALSRFYDAVVALTVRNALHKRTLAEQAVVEAGEHVLDLGCGTGTLSILIQRFQPGCDVTALDADAEMLDQARRKARRQGAAIRLVQGLAQDRHFPEAHFDCVLSSLFFHHLDRLTKERTLLEVHRILRPGGRLHLVDWGKPANPVMAWTFRLVRILDGFDVTEDNVQGRLPALLRAAGFENVEVRGRMNTVFGTLEFLSAGKQYPDGNTEPGRMADGGRGDPRLGSG